MSWRLSYPACYPCRFNRCLRTAKSLMRCSRTSKGTHRSCRSSAIARSSTATCWTMLSRPRRLRDLRGAIFHACEPGSLTALACSPLPGGRQLLLRQADAQSFGGQLCVAIELPLVRPLHVRILSIPTRHAGADLRKPDIAQPDEHDAHLSAVLVARVAPRLDSFVEYEGR